MNKVMDNLDKYYDTFGVSLNIFRRLLKEWIVQILCPIFILNTKQKIETQHNGRPIQQPLDLCGR